MDPGAIKQIIEEAIPESQATVVDTGGGNHFEAVIISKQFEGKSMIAQHRMVYDALGKSIADETIHAIALKTMTPAQSGSGG
ncbi:MAG: BolA/IbaG family iron-sulfur metabolism protein [Deltaproteobacteria bacterium]|nr:BolA/IbaG family iron-sulfur metabolism protein [Deltaproteobacteria bacterium]